jgi:hypothetical protein
MVDMAENPFKIGDAVRFIPDERAQGWSWFGPGTIQPNDVGIVSRIQDRDYVYIKRSDDSEVGGFYWSCFEPLG